MLPYKIYNGSFCFPAGTLVKTEGGLLPIEEVKCGDRVWSYDEATENVKLSKVELAHANMSRCMSMAIEGWDHKLAVTAEHPFFVIGAGWTRAIDIEEGAILKTFDDSHVRVVKINAPDSKIDAVYNVRVSETHTYFVTEKEILVHNK